MSDWRAAGFVAGASPTGIVTRPKVSDPFQLMRMADRPQCRRTDSVLPSTTNPYTAVHANARILEASVCSAADRCTSEPLESVRGVTANDRAAVA